MSKLSVVLFVLFTLVGRSFSVISKTEKPEEKLKSIGKSCIIKKTGQLGLCTNIDHCDYAKDLLKRKKWKSPQTCGEFLGIYPIVCCPAPRSEVVCRIFHPPTEPCIKTEVSGGQPSFAREFPHMAVLGYGDKANINWFCGGSLISEQYVLTAAHCIKTKDYGNVRFVRLGDLDLGTTEDENRFESQPQDFTVAEFFLHPKYKRPIHYHDIALIKLDRPARFSVFVQPACLHTERPVPNDLTISGWGKVDLYGSTSSHLLKANIFYVNYTTCASRYSSSSGFKRTLPNGILNDIQVCAGHPEGRDTCPGDSGGPIQYKLFSENPHFRIVGVTSFGQGCGIGNTVAVYSRVSEYRQWIEDIVWSNNTFSLSQML